MRDRDTSWGSRFNSRGCTVALLIVNMGLAASRPLEFRIIVIIRCGNDRISYIMNAIKAVFILLTLIPTSTVLVVIL